MTNPQAIHDPLDLAWAEIQEHGLEPYVAELDAHGYTVIPPRVAAPDGLSERILAAALDAAERRTGVRPDLDTGATHADFTDRLSTVEPGAEDSPFGDAMQSMLFEDPVFEEAMMNPVLLAMATWLCGYSVVLSSMICQMKGPNKSSLALHADTPLPSPLPPQSLTCNCIWVLTDFDLANGTTCFVPGSHRWCREPVGAERIVGGAHGNPHVVPVEAEAGSLLCIHGNVWHGAFNRTAPGLRVNLALYMARPFIRTQEDLIGKVPQQMLDRNSPRFAILTQQAIAYGYTDAKDSVERGKRAAKYALAYAKARGGKGVHASEDVQPPRPFLLYG